MERARLLAEGEINEPYTAYLALRVRPTIKKLWDAAPPEAKKAARSTLEAVLLAFYLGGHTHIHQHHQQPLIMNLNLNMNIAHAEAHAKTSIQQLLNLLDKLAKELQFIQNLTQHPTTLNTTIIHNKIKGLLNNINNERNKLKTILEHN